jgi:hypothetical protein
MATSKAIAAYRGARALELAVAGVPYAQITEALGHRSSGAASKAMWRAIDRRTAEGVDAYREQQLRRLDMVERAYWTKALVGSTKAAEVVLSVTEKRIRLLSLDRVGAQVSGPTEVIDPAFWAHVREAHDGRMESYLEAHRSGDCQEP